jgi:hypothetical protein
MYRGVVYEGREVTLEDARSRGLDHGYYFKRPGDGRSWDELASLPRCPKNGSMRGLVVVVAEVFQLVTSCDLEWGHVHLGRLILIGDPAELRSILEALGYPIESHPDRS